MCDIGSQPLSLASLAKLINIVNHDLMERKKRKVRNYFNLQPNLPQPQLASYLVTSSCTLSAAQVPSQSICKQQLSTVTEEEEKLSYQDKNIKTIFRIEK